MMMRIIIHVWLLARHTHDHIVLKQDSVLQQDR
jgi:hypothetical protein